MTMCCSLAHTLGHHSAFRAHVVVGLDFRAVFVGGRDRADSRATFGSRSIHPQIWLEELEENDAKKDWSGRSETRLAFHLHTAGLGQAKAERHSKASLRAKLRAHLASVVRLSPLQKKIRPLSGVRGSPRLSDGLSAAADVPAFTYTTATEAASRAQGESDLDALLQAAEQKTTGWESE